MDIDNRSVKDIENRIRELSRGYVPEWHFDPEHADIGAAIARIFALSMKENIDLANRSMERFHAEFVNMLDLSLEAAKPAGCMVKFELIEDTIPGTQIRKGTRLVARSEETVSGQVIFETNQEIYVTNSRLTDAFMTDREDGSFVPLLGEYVPVPLLDGVPDRSRDTEEEPGRTEDPETSGDARRSFGINRRLRPFVLFSEDNNIARSALVLYHESLFDIEGEPIYIRLEGNDGIMEGLKNKEYVLKYYSAAGFREFDEVHFSDDGVTIEVSKEKKCRHLVINGRSYAVVILEAAGVVRAAEELSRIGLSSSGRERCPDFVTDGTNDLSVEEFAPFSDTLSVYNECYVGQDLYFSKAGARITLSFQVLHRETGLYLTRQEEQAELKVIKRKPRMMASEIPAEAFADEISMEYFNGIGWKNLPVDMDVTGVLGGAGAGSISISFTCPSDWERIQAGAYFGRAVRIRLIKSDNCFLRPGIHHYPVIGQFRAAFTYEGHFEDPDRVYRISGTVKDEITEQLKTGRRFTAVSGGTYHDDALYLGFNHPMENGPVSLFFELEDQINMNTMKCRYEYSAGDGFKPLKVIDSTKDFSRTGNVVFMPPSDMQSITLEGKKRIWIRIRRAELQDEHESRLFLPKIRSIMTNVVFVTNTTTEKEVDYYLDDTSPNQHFSLGRKSILDAEVWVNEKRSILKEEIDRMLSEQPEDIRVEHDMLGGISAVYVKWQETAGFDTASDPRSYMIDRMNGELIFSDGVKAKMPRVTDDVAFKVRVRTSDGAAGNVEPDAIHETVGTELYIDRVYNPVRAYGGADMETVPQAFRRGANLLSSRGRLVSDKDYVYSILNFSDSIDQVVSVPGETVDGKQAAGDISFVLLMKDFREGSFSFHRISGPLRQYLKKLSPLTISQEHIHVVEPIFVSVSVSIWASVLDEDASFEIQHMIINTLKEFLNPLKGEETGGWPIGILPKSPQIKMRLGMLKNRAVIKRTTITAHYVDRSGEHTMDLDDVQVTPFMAVRSGEHKVNIDYEGEDV